MDWYYAEGGDPNGPHSDEDIRSLLLTERINDCLLWRDGMPGWTPLRDLPEFADSLPKKATPPPIPAAPPPVPKSGSRWTSVSNERATAPATTADKKPEGWGEPIFVPAAERREFNQSSPWSRYFARSLWQTLSERLPQLRATP
jgi:hypothetical protein